MLDPHRLRIFRSVIASGSLQAAADNLRMTSSAVSQHMSRLQAETGLVLFERAGRGVQPTAAARILAAQSDDAMAQLERLDEVVADLRDGRTGRLTIGYFSSAGPVWMPDLVTQLTDEMPDLVVELLINEIARPSIPPDIDLVDDFPDAATPSGMHRTDLTDDPYVAVLADDHPLAGRARISLLDLKGDTWVSHDLPSNPAHRILVASCAAAGFRPRFSVQAGDQHTAMEFVRAGVGVSVLPRLAAAARPHGVRRVPLHDPVPVRRISALTRETVAPNRAAARALELLTGLIQRTDRAGGRR